MLENIEKKLIAKNWSNKANSAKRLSWWEHSSIVSHVNELISGIPNKTPSGGGIDYLRTHFPNRVFEKAISVGAGSAVKEMNLMEKGLVNTFTIYELSSDRIKRGRRIAKEKGLDERIQFHLGNAFVQPISDNSFDFVHWDNSLHHMPDTCKAIEWSYRILKPGGVFYMNDFIGPNRLQWTPAMIRAANLVRTLLPEKYFVNPLPNKKPLKKTVSKLNRLFMYFTDPSEAADSENIVPALKKYFPNATLKPLGGVIYHLALTKIICNFVDEKDELLLKKLLTFDQFLSEQGLNHYGFLCEEKPLGL